MAKVLVHVEKNILGKVKNELSTNKDVANNDKNIITEQLFKNYKEKTIKNQQNNNKATQITKDQQKASQNSPQQKGKTIRQIEQFFEQRYLGPKKNTKIADFNKLSKIPLFNPQLSSKIFPMKTPNLNLKLKQIEKIFNVQKKSSLLSRKKILVQSQNFSQFQLYLTKRDVLRQKNESLEDMRKFWQEQKKIQQEKRQKRKLLKNNKKVEQPTKNTVSEIEVKTSEQQQKANQQQQTKENPSQIKQTNDSPSLKSKSMSLTSQMNNDDYFQKKFQQKIVKNSLSTKHKFSIRSMLQPSRNKKTTISSLEFFKNQLDTIENVARNTIDNFHHREKINKILYSQPTEQQEQLKSALMSKRETPIIKDDQLKDTKSIDWVLKQCQNFKKRFNIRKTRSLSNIKKHT